MKKILILWLCLGLAGCATMSLSKIASNNKDNLDKLSIGMSEQEVLNIMGTKSFRSTVWNFYTKINNPCRSETIKIQNGRTIKILYYFTNKLSGDTGWESYVVKNNELTPLIFENGKLIGKDKGSLDLILQGKL